jgi:hypothetical protein
MKQAIKTYLYELGTGKFLEEKESYGAVERMLEIPKGTVYDVLRRGNGRIASRNVVVSKTKYDVFPIENFPNLQKYNKVFKVDKSTILQEVKTPEITMSEEQLRQKHDMFFMVFTYVKAIPPTKFVEEGQLLRELGLVGKPRYRDAITRPELREYKGKVDGTVYYGSIESIKKLKSEGVLQ